MRTRWNRSWPSGDTRRCRCTTCACRSGQLDGDSVERRGASVAAHCSGPTAGADRGVAARLRRIDVRRAVCDACIGGGRVVRNKVCVTVDHRADWWLGSEASVYFALLRDAVRHEWKAEPISIREGGSIPAIAILEKELARRQCTCPWARAATAPTCPTNASASPTSSRATTSSCASSPGSLMCSAAQCKEWKCRQGRV